jgi:hypothetical protein
MRTIAEAGNSFFLHLGDLHYQDITVNQTALFLAGSSLVRPTARPRLTAAAAYDMALTAPHARSMWQAMGVDYVWDDHDFGPNDSDGLSPSRLSAISSYSQAVPMLHPFPSSSCTPQTGEIFHSFAWSRLRARCCRCALASL